VSIVIPAQSPLTCVSSFIAYRALPHLNLKHTIFGRIIDDPTPSFTTLSTLETHPVEPTTNRPTPEVRITDITVFVDPFEDFLSKKRAEESRATGATGPSAEEEDERIRREEDDRVTWTGKRVRGTGEDSNEGSGDVGKYLKTALADQNQEDEVVEFVDDEPEPEPARKKVKSGGYGNFSSW
jgi:peptidyl-prolyl cis-trans isomerase-like protein 2